MKMHVLVLCPVRGPQASAPAKGIAEIEAQVLLCEMKDIQACLDTHLSLEGHSDKAARKVVLQANSFAIIESVLYFIDP